MESSRVSKKKYIKPKKLIKQNGGNDVIHASIDLINSMVDLGKSIFVEINSISNVSSQLNNGAIPNEFPAKNHSPPKESQPNL